MKLLYGEGLTVSDYDLLVYTLVDTAGGVSAENATKRSDRWGLVTLAVSAAAEYFVLEWIEKHLTEEAFVHELWALDARWHPYRIGIEASPHLFAYLRLAMTRKGHALNIVPLKPAGRKKERRIQALSAILPNMHFNATFAGAVQQTLRRWHAEQEHGDDAIDALAYVLDLCRPPTAQQLVEQRAIRAAGEEREALERLPASQRPEWEAWLKYEKRGEPDIMEEMYGYD